MFQMLFFAALVGSASSFADAKAPIATSGKNRVPLVELYSSESCSSCPPADAWVSTLKDRPGLWKTFVPVVFHVDYWNHLGWKDGLSSDKMTKRQRELSSLWTEPSVYTPAFIVNGNEWRDWRNTGKSFPAGSSHNIELAIFKEGEDTFRIKVTGLDPAKRYLIRAAELGMDIQTNVKGGENSGLLLKHNFVVLDWEGKALSSKSPEQSFKFKIEKQKPSRLAVAAWVEEEGNPTPLQSVGGYL